MPQRVLVTGGAGFIGSHVVDRLLRAGHEVVVLDNLDPQVHGPGGARPAYLDARAELVVGDVRDPAVVAGCVERVTAVLHLAAAVGVGQSMYEVRRFVDVNCSGTAVVLEAVIARKTQIRKLIVASSMCLYGEGRCASEAVGPFDPAFREEAALQAKDFEIHCPKTGQVARPIPTPEDARLQPTTVYATTKRDQEELVLSVGNAYGIPAVALRLFNVYGPRQALSNPYTGVGAIFSSCLLGGTSPIVFEDGRQTRDFTHVADVAEAFGLALEKDGGDGMALNVGAGRPHTLMELGQLLAAEIGVPWQPTITHAFRKGDIRHCTSSTTRLEAALGFRPRVSFEEGVPDLVAWVRTQRGGGGVERAYSELQRHGLIS
jgi:dTDP-L-rhamnose 4-epimerase